MSYTATKNTLKRINEQVRSTNWLARVYFRSALRSLTIRQKGGGARIVVTLLSLLFFHYFPLLVLASYMSYKGFFSYDMFKDGVSGVTAFYWWMEAMLIVSSAYVAGSLFFVIQSKIKHNNFLPYKDFLFWVFLFMNLLMLWVMFGYEWKTNSGFNKEHLFYTWLICVWIVAHVAIVTNGTAKAAFRSLLFGITALTTISFLQPGALALPYSLSLQYFGNGGDIAATIQLAKGHNSIHGRLVLKSPDHVYFYQEGLNSLSVIALKDIETITVENLSGFGHRTSNQKSSTRTL